MVIGAVSILTALCFSGLSEAEMRKEIESKVRQEADVKMAEEKRSIEERANAKAEVEKRELQAKMAAKMAEEKEQRRQTEAKMAEQAEKLQREKAELHGKAVFLDSIAGALCGVVLFYSQNLKLSSCCLTGVYHKTKLKFEITRVEPVKSTAALERFKAAQKRLNALKESKVGEESKMEAADVEERFVFHSCPPDVIPLICENTLRPSICAKCKKGKECEDSGDSICCSDSFQLTLSLYWLIVGFFGDHTRGVYVSKHVDYTFFYVRTREVKEGDEGATIVFQCVTGRRKHFGEMVRSTQCISLSN